MSERADNERILTQLFGVPERKVEFLRSLGVLPPEPTGSFDGGAREVAPAVYPTAQEIERDHDQTVLGVIEESRWRKDGA